MENINRKVKEAMRLAPYPHQYEGIRFIEQNEGRCFLFWDMGLGKTMAALGWSSIHPEKMPVLIVCPASIKINWQKEAKKFIGADAIILSGRKPKPLNYKGIYIINYDIVTYWLPEIQKAKFQIMICDEMHYAKNQKSKRTKAIKQLSRSIPHIIGLTGTPVTNKPIDLFAPMGIIKPRLFPSWWSYAQKYCGMKRTPWGIDVSGATNLTELHDKIAPYCIRRKKSEVLKDLPERQVIVRPVELTNRKTYNKAEKDFLEWLQNVKPEKLSAALRAEGLVKLNELRNLVVAGKMKAIEEFIDDFLETSDSKLIIMMCHKKPLHDLYNKYKKQSVLIDGSVSMKKRDAAVEKFQNDSKTRVFFGNIIAAGTGLTLTAADTLVFGELSYVPAEHAQAADRNYRIGQEAAHVSCYYMIADNTLEEKVCEALHKKMKVIDQILDGEITDSEGWDFKKELFMKIKNKK